MANKYFKLENLENFKREKKEVMEILHLYFLTNELQKNKILTITDSDKISDKEKIIQLFKNNSEYKEIKDESGNVITKWVSNEEFSKKCKDDYIENNDKIKNVDKMQINIQNDIYNEIKFEKENGKRLSETNAITYMTMLDQITYYQGENSGLSNLRLKIASLASDIEELNEFKIKLSESNVFDKRIIIDKKYMIEDLFSKNDIYSLFNADIKKYLIDSFFNESDFQKKSDYISIYSTMNRTSSSDLLKDINKDERMSRVDCLLNEPENLNNYKYYDGIMFAAYYYIKNNVNENNMESVVKEALLPLSMIINMGGIDTLNQKDKLIRPYEDFESKVLSIDFSEPKKLMNYIDVFIENKTIEREENTIKNSFIILEKMLNNDDYKKEIPEDIINKIIDNFNSFTDENKKMIVSIAEQQKETNILSINILKNPDVLEYVKNKTEVERKKERAKSLKY